MGVNKVILVGNLGADPDMRFTKSGEGVCEMRLATNEKWKDKNGQWQERAEWHRAVCWGSLGENCAKYLSKGSQVYVEGKLRTREWQDKDGNKRWTTEVVARDVQFLDGKGKQSREPDSGGGGEPPDMPDDDIPFVSSDVRFDVSVHAPGGGAV